MMVAARLRVVVMPVMMMMAGGRVAVMVMPHHRRRGVITRADFDPDAPHNRTPVVIVTNRAGNVVAAADIRPSGFRFFRQQAAEAKSEGEGGDEFRFHGFQELK